MTLTFGTIQTNIEVANKVVIVVKHDFTVHDITTDTFTISEEAAELDENINTVAFVTEKACLSNLLDVLALFNVIVTGALDQYILQPEQGIAYVNNNVVSNMNDDIFIATVIHHSFKETLTFKGENLIIKDWVIPGWKKWYDLRSESRFNILPVSIGDDMNADLLA